MRSRQALLGCLVAGALVVGCGASPGPTWTYVPVPTQSPIPPPSPSSSSTLGSATPAAAPSAGTVLDLTARNIAFDKKTVDAPAGTAFTIHFDNEDAGVSHDVAILRGSADGDQVFEGKVITGAASVDYQVPPLTAGTYTLICTLHPTLMIATLTVK